jgi:hypothetical protein
MTRGLSKILGKSLKTHSCTPNQSVLSDLISHACLFDKDLILWVALDGTVTLNMLRHQVLPLALQAVGAEIDAQDWPSWTNKYSDSFGSLPHLVLPTPAQVATWYRNNLGKRFPVEQSPPQVRVIEKEVRVMVPVPADPSNIAVSEMNVCILGAITRHALGSMGRSHVCNTQMSICRGHTEVCTSLLKPLGALALFCDNGHIFRLRIHPIDVPQVDLGPLVLAFRNQVRRTMSHAPRARHVVTEKFPCMPDMIVAWCARAGGTEYGGQISIRITQTASFQKHVRFCRACFFSSFNSSVYF